MTPIEQLAHTPLEAERYHADGHGHLQVEQVSYPPGSSPRELLQEIADHALWPELLQLARMQGAAWWQALQPYLPEQRSGVTRFRVNLLQLPATRMQQLMLLQKAPGWHWDASLAPELQGVIAQAKQLQDQISNALHADPLEQLLAEPELSELIERLQALHDCRFED